MRTFQRSHKGVGKGCIVLLKERSGIVSHGVEAPTSLRTVQSRRLPNGRETPPPPKKRPRSPDVVDSSLPGSSSHSSSSLRSMKLRAPLRLSSVDTTQKLKDKKVWCGVDGTCVIALPTRSINHQKLLRAVQHMDAELGYAMDSDVGRDTMAFFFVDNVPRILGVLLAEEINSKVNSVYLHEEITLQQSPPMLESTVGSLTKRLGLNSGRKARTCDADCPCEERTPKVSTSEMSTRRRTRSQSTEAPASPTTAKVISWAESASTGKSPQAKFDWSMCGISRIWVHSCARRRGIATILVEVARKHLVYGFEFPPSQVAFSQPTRDGKLFARTYTGTEQLMVY